MAFVTGRFGSDDVDRVRREHRLGLVRVTDRRDDGALTVSNCRDDGAQSLTYRGDDGAPTVSEPLEAAAERVGLTGNEPVAR